MDKLSELKAAAMAATPGPWFVHEKPCEDGNYGIDTSDNEWTAEAVVWWGFARESIWREEDARFIAAANPAAVLALLAELEAKTLDGRCIEQERELFRVERTAHQQHAQDLEKRIAELEAKLATPVRLPNKNDDEFWFDGVFQVARFDRAVERAVSTAGFKFVGEE